MYYLSCKNTSWCVIGQITAIRHEDVDLERRFGDALLEHKKERPSPVMGGASHLGPLDRWYA